MPGTPGAGWNDDEVLDWKQRQLILSCIEVAAVRKKLFVIMEVTTTTVDFENGGSTVRHHICQKIYATAIFGPKNLRKKSVNRDKNEFATK